jgi:hypothetical protein
VDEVHDTATVFLISLTSSRHSSSLCSSRRRRPDQQRLHLDGIDDVDHKHPSSRLVEMHLVVCNG